MRKIVLSMLVAGSLLATSCKGTQKDVKDLKDAAVEAAGNAADATKDAANSVADGAKEVAGDAVDATKDAANAVKDGAEKMVDGAKEVISGVSIPEFSNPAVTKNLTDYAAYAKDYIAADGNLGKISAMAAKGKTLVEEGKALAAKLSGDELAKYKSALAAIQSKMAPSN